MTVSILQILTCVRCQFITRDFFAAEITYSIIYCRVLKFISFDHGKVHTHSNFISLTFLNVRFVGKIWRIGDSVSPSYCKMEVIAQQRKASIYEPVISKKEFSVFLYYRFDLMLGQKK